MLPDLLPELIVSVPLVDVLVSLRQSDVQIAPDELQFVVAGSRIVRSPVPAGRTLSFQPTWLPWVLRLVRLMLPPVTLTAFLVMVPLPYRRR